MRLQHGTRSSFQDCVYIDTMHEFCLQLGLLILDGFCYGLILGFTFVLHQLGLKYLLYRTHDDGETVETRFRSAVALFISHSNL